MLFSFTSLAAEEKTPEAAATKKVELPDKNVAMTQGQFEKLSLERYLTEFARTLDEKPEGKKVRQLLVKNLDVFGRDDGFLRMFNFFHVTSKKYTVAREVLLQPGDNWNQKLIQESKRRLRSPTFTSYVVIAPLKTEDPDTVDLLVITRDVWSLRLNSVFEFQGSNLTFLFVSPAENNVLGYRKFVSFAFELDQGNYTVGPIYRDPNILGSRLTLFTRAGLVFSRAESEFEGSFSTIELNYPLWQLASKWGAGVEFSHNISTIRDFVGNAIRTFDPDENVDGDELPFVYDWRRFDITTSAVRQIGKDFKHRFRLGHVLQSLRPTLNDVVPNDSETLQIYQENIFPRSERISSIFFQISGFQNKFTLYRDLNSYDLSEDVRLGLTYFASASVARQEFGSENNFTNLSFSLSHVWDLDEDGFFSTSASYSSRLQESDVIDNLYGLSMRAAFPRVANAFRVVGRMSLSARRNESANRFFRLGGDNGLRGFAIGAFSGLTQVVGNLEMRSIPYRIGFLRVGGLLFWDMGDAADEFNDLSFKHDVGAGIRWLLPQLQPVVFRFDWAIPINGPSAGFPGRISGGVEQAF